MLKVPNDKIIYNNYFLFLLQFNFLPVNFKKMLIWYFQENISLNVEIEIKI